MLKKEKNFLYISINYNIWSFLIKSHNILGFKVGEKTVKKIKFLILESDFRACQSKINKL